MADNVPFGGPYSVATVDAGGGVQHQKVINEFSSGGGVPIQVGTIAPIPTESDNTTALLTSILIELRVQNSMLYALAATEVEPLDDMRRVMRDLPVSYP